MPRVTVERVCTTLRRVTDLPLAEAAAQLVAAARLAETTPYPTARATGRAVSHAHRASARCLRGETCSTCLHELRHVQGGSGK